MSSSLTPLQDVTGTFRWIPAQVMILTGYFDSIPRGLDGAK